MFLMIFGTIVTVRRKTRTSNLRTLQYPSRRQSHQSEQPSRQSLGPWSPLPRQCYHIHHLWGLSPSWEWSCWAQLNPGTGGITLLLVNDLMTPSPSPHSLTHLHYLDVLAPVLLTGDVRLHADEAVGSGPGMSRVTWTGSGKPVLTHLKLWESLPLVAMARTCSWLCASSRRQRCFSSSWSWPIKREY